MSITARLLAALGASALLVTAAAVGTAAYLVWSYGMMEVEVHGGGPAGADVSIRIPAVLARAAVEFIPRQAVHQVSDDARAWLPVAREAFRGLAHGPDATFVDVRSCKEKVSVSKRGSSLVVAADTPGETVRVSIPWRTASSILEELEERI